MNSIIQNVKKRINGTSRDSFDDESLIEVHHILMKEYGWIPLEEFKKLPAPTMHNLLWCIKRDKEAENRAYKKAKR